VVADNKPGAAIAAPTGSWDDAYLPEGWTVRRLVRLTGGTADPVWRATLGDGREVVVKAAADAPQGKFETEAEGLRVLADLGGLPTVEVVAVTPRSIVLDALDPESPLDDEFWADAGRRVAELHGVRGERHGWSHDGWLGRLPQHNAWDADGYRFFAENRVLRYLPEPGVEASLDASERRGIERICERLPELVPDHGPRLTHGDLWRNNLLRGRAGEPVFMDPAVSYAWAEVDLSMILSSGGVPDSFFAAYGEVRPLDREWREHARILNLRQLLALLAFFGPNPVFIEPVRSLIADYA